MTTTNTLIIKPPTADLPKPALATVTAINQAKTAFVAGSKPTAKRAAPRTLAESKDRALKLMGYGKTGSGKTLIIKTFLEAGLKVLAISTDFGGEGFVSVELAMRRAKKADLLANCVALDLATYDDLEAFIFSPDKFYPEIYDTDFDVLVWDGFSSYQTCLLDEKVLSFSPQGKEEKISDAREAGLFAGMQDWGAIKRGTTKFLDKFLRMKNEKTGKLWHKYLTCIENAKPKEDKLSGETKISPLIQGAGGTLIEPSFDLIFRTRRKLADEGGKKVVKYFYELNSSDAKCLTKKRGFEIPDQAEGDFMPIWKAICEQRGVNPGPLA